MHNNKRTTDSHGDEQISPIFALPSISTLPAPSGDFVISQMYTRDSLQARLPAHRPAIYCCQPLFLKHILNRPLTGFKSSGPFPVPCRQSPPPG